MHVWTCFLPSPARAAATISAVAAAAEGDREDSATGGGLGLTDLLTGGTSTKPWPLVLDGVTGIVKGEVGVSKRSSADALSELLRGACGTSNSAPAISELLLGAGGV